MTEYVANEDVTKIVALLSDIIEHRHLTISELRRRFLDGLGRLIDTPHWVWGHSVVDDQARPAYFAALYSNSFTQVQLDVIKASSSDPRYLDDTRAAIGDVWGREHFTVMREVFQPDIHWLDPNHPMGKVRLAGFIDGMWSLYPLSARGISGIGFWRFQGQVPLTHRERNIAHIVLSQVDWLHREGTNVPAVDHITDLTLRQRAVLIHLISGSSVKQIADKLDLSEHTVRDHTKELHRIFDVQSRGELLARKRRGITRFQITESIHAAIAPAVTLLDGLAQFPDVHSA